MSSFQIVSRTAVLATLAAGLSFSATGAKGSSAAREAPLSPAFARKLQDPDQFVVNVREMARESNGPATKSLCGLDSLEHVRHINRHRQHTATVRSIQPRVGGLAIRRFGTYVYCTGTLLDDTHVLTASHCIEDETLGKVVMFGFEMTVDGLEAGTLARRIRRVVVDGVDTGLDYAVIQIDPIEESGTPRLDVGSPKNGDTIGVLQHPFGEMKQVDFGVVSGLPSMFGYKADTAKSSSGAPVFDARGRLVAVHTTGGCGLISGLNSGVDVQTIEKDLRTRVDNPEAQTIAELLR